MKLSVKKEKLNNCSYKYSFEGELNIYTVNELWMIITEGLNYLNKMELDFNDIGKFDSAGLQLLVNISREAEKLNKEVVIIGASEVVREVFCTYDLCF